MIKTEKIPSTKTIHNIYCDDCGKFITSSVEYDDGYYKNPADFSCSIYTDDRYTLEKELCEECKQKYYTKIRNALLDDAKSCAIHSVIEELEQDPCEDAIRRQAVMDCFKKWQPYMATRLHEFEKELSALPPVNPQPKTGKWMETDSADPYWYMCSECHRRLFEQEAYCPSCGAKMK